MTGDEPMTSLRQKIWKARYRWASFRQFRGSSRQGFVRFQGRGDLFVPTDDKRGRWILASHGVTQPRANIIWKVLHETFDPTIIVDCGANYGEFTFTLRLTAQQRLHLFECNPLVIPYLQKSLASHRHQDRITLHEVAVSDAAGTMEFFFRPQWSGTSSLGALTQPRSEEIREATEVRKADVPVETTDAVLRKSLSSDDSLIMKVDVEGHEYRAIKGAAETLRSVKGFALITEIDKDYAQAHGSNSADLLGLLSELGIVKYIDPKGRIRELSSEVDLPNHCDILVFSRNWAERDLRFTPQQRFVAKID